MKVRSLSRSANSRLFAKLPFDEKAWLATAGNSGAASGEGGFSTIERIWARPTAEINGMWGGHTGAGGKTIVPREAHGHEFYEQIGKKGGKKGGEATRDRYGPNFYERIGQKGGQRVKQLIEEGKRAAAEARERRAS